MAPSHPIADLHGTRAALRGNPSFVWRAGQQRRLEMILAWATSPLQRVLVDGCGVGMYVGALQPHTREIYGIDIEGEHLTRAVDAVPDAHLQLARRRSVTLSRRFFRSHAFA